MCNTLIMRVIALVLYAVTKVTKICSICSGYRVKCVGDAGARVVDMGAKY